MREVLASLEVGHHPAGHYNSVTPVINLTIHHAQCPLNGTLGAEDKNVTPKLGEYFRSHLDTF